MSVLLEVRATRAQVADLTITTVNENSIYPDSVTQCARCTPVRHAAGRTMLAAWMDGEEMRR